jgi:ribosomal protein S27E
MQFILKGKSLDKESRRYLCQIECPKCGLERTVWFAGWSALMCGGCKRFIDRPEVKQ